MDATDDGVPDPLTPDHGRALTPDDLVMCIVRVLGPLEVSSEGVAASLGSPKQRAVLIVLALNINEVVSTDKLIVLLWGDRAPRTAVHSIQIYVSELRKALASLVGAPVIVTVPTGYRLEIRPDAVDVYRFEQLVQDGRRALRASDVATGMNALRAAVGLWRGPALQEFAYDDFAQSHIRRLSDLRLDVVEELAAAELGAGYVREALEQIELVVDEDPLREGFVELLMLALYRSGRHVNALRAYQSHREMLAVELGVVPSPTLQRLYERILLHDPSLRPERSDVHSLPESAHNPYKGLRPFRESDAGDFFGRDLLIGRTIALLSAGQRLISLVGPSGSGKSSVVGAGLVPKLRAGAVSGSADWLIVTLIPGEQPLRDVEAAIAREAAGGTSPVPAGDVHDERPDLVRALPDMPSEGRVLLVLDQFEQLFLAADELSQRRFLDALSAAVTGPDARLTVVLTLRADHYDRPLLHARFAAAFTPGVLNVLPMASTEVEAAVVGPAARVGVDVEPALLAELVADTADQPGSLPLLQYALTDLFDRETGPYLTLAGYNALGGLRGLVARRADDLYDALGEQERAVAMQLLLRMVRVGRGSDDAGRRVLMSEFTGLDLDPVALSEVLDQFGRNRLLSFDRDQNTGAPTVELAHEALLKQWERFADWVEIHREALRRVESVRVAAANWEDSGRHPDYLLSGVRLAEAEAHGTNSAIAVSASERDFINASIDRRRAEQDAETARLANQRQLERRARLRLAGLALALVLLIGAVIVGVVAHNGGKAKHVALFYAANGELGLLIGNGFDRGVADFGFVAKKVDDYPDPELRLNSLSAGQQLVMVFSIVVDVDFVARQHAGTRYVLLDRRVNTPNVTSVEFAHNEGSYLVGAAAALKTKTGTIGFIGGVDTDVIWQFQAGFEAGARAIDPGVRILKHYLASPPNYGGGFLSPTAGERAARELYANGADVIFAAAGTSGLGVFQAAVDLSTPSNKLWAIGVDSDQYLTVANLPGSVGAAAWQEHILTSMIKRYDKAVYTVLDSFAHGHLAPTPQLLGLAENGVDISYSGGYIDDIKPKIEALRQAIISGKVRVPCRPLDRPSSVAPAEPPACGP